MMIMMTLTWTFLCVPLYLCGGLFAATAAVHIQHSARLDTRAYRLLTGQRLAGQRSPAEQRDDVPGAFESDMRLTSQQLDHLLRQQRHEEERDTGGRTGGRWRRKAVAHHSYLWPSRIVPYAFHSDFPASYRQTVLQAMRFWQRSTCIKFVPLSDSLTQYLRHMDHVLFTKGDGCQSSIGRVGSGEQTTDIADHCNEFGSVSHELGHVLGFYHEQSRPDRDNHVIILRHNILPGRHHNFLKYSSTEILADEPYDIGSVMHYGPTYFSQDGLSLTIDTPEETFRAVMGQREGPSFIDVKTANHLYNCTDKCGQKKRALCRNQGYVGPDCTCVCPLGLRGRQCTDVIPSTHECGGVLRSTTGILQSPGFDHGYGYGNNVDCVWLIQGPYGSRPTTVTLVMEVFEMEDDVIQPCAFDWLEFRSLGPHLHGQRFCGEGPSEPLVYRGQGSGLVVTFHSDESFTFGGFRLRYFVRPTDPKDTKTPASGTKDQKERTRETGRNGK
ncbi:protein SpAN-like [Babylonia areolata]|uniref:protein SpAN-like n=1 Tax=Babylonia areolata TaxID=304850 RepID=UPI003FD52F08